MLATHELCALCSGPWAPLVLALLAVGDAFLPALPSEVVLAMAVATATASGAPTWWVACLLVATGAGALVGDLGVHALARAATSRQGALDGQGTTAGTPTGAGSPGPLGGRGVTGRILSAARTGLAVVARVPAVIIGGRFLPGARIAVVAGAGAAGMTRLRFAGIDTVAIILWCVVHGGIAVEAGAHAPGGPLTAGLVGAIAGCAVGLLSSAAAALHRRVAEGASTVEKAPAPR